MAFNVAKEAGMPQENFGSRLDRALATPEASVPAELPWSDASVVDEVRDALAAPVGPALVGPAPVDAARAEPAPIASEPSMAPRADALELERHVQALERLLQALLVQLANSVPDLLARLEDAFCASSQSAHADDDKAIDSRAAALIQAARRNAGEGAEPPPDAADTSPPEAEARRGDRHNDQLSFRRPAFHYRKVGGIWRLTMDAPPQSPAKKEDAKKEDGKSATAAVPRGAFTSPPGL